MEGRTDAGFPPLLRCNSAPGMGRRRGWEEGNSRGAQRVNEKKAKEQDINNHVDTAPWINKP